MLALVACLRSNVRRSEEHTSELQSLAYLVCRLLLEKKKTNYTDYPSLASDRQVGKHVDNCQCCALVSPMRPTCLYTNIYNNIFFCIFFFFFNDTAPTEIYTLSLHDVLPIYIGSKLLPLNIMDSNTSSSLISLEFFNRSEEHTSELQSLAYLVCRLLLEK